MALTLLEAQKHARTPQELAVVTELAAGQLMSVLPFRTIEGNGLFWKREESLPDVGFRNYNGALAESYAEVSQQSESLKLFGGDIKVDKAIISLEGAEAKAYQIQSRVRAMRMAWEALFINGDSNQSPSEFDGLAARIASGSSQYFANGGGALDLGVLDEAIDNVDAQGGRKYLVMSKSLRRALTRQTRTNTQIDITRNEFGYQQYSYMGLPVLELDRDNKNVAILDSTPSAQDMYVVSFGNDHLTGIQNGGVNVRELGEDHAQPQMITRVEWYCGLALINGRAAARVAGIDATVDPT
ncbi:major capsid protein [Synechococcus phage S-CRES2]|nr:major capsid protein [Synechococcus phage S-CRES2]